MRFLVTFLVLPFAFVSGCGGEAGKCGEDPEDTVSCSDEEKECPVDLEDPEGEHSCVSIYRPETGCANDGCDPCDLPNAVARCSPSGECSIAVCNTDDLDCDGDSTNGCEVDTSRDLANCGDCGVVCAFANSSEACVEGQCQIGVCLGGFEDCDGSKSNGCEADTDTDIDHCGECDSPCDGECVDGECM